MTTAETESLLRLLTMLDTQLAAAERGLRPGRSGGYYDGLAFGLRLACVELRRIIKVRGPATNSRAGGRRRTPGRTDAARIAARTCE